MDAASKETQVHNTSILELMVIFVFRMVRGSISSKKVGFKMARCRTTRLRGDRGGLSAAQRSKTSNLKGAFPCKGGVERVLPQETGSTELFFCSVRLTNCPRRISFHYLHTLRWKMLDSASLIILKRHRAFPFHRLRDRCRI